VIAGNNVERDCQPIDRRLHQPVLVFGTVIGIVARQHGKVYAVSEVVVGVFDQREKVAIILLIRLSNMKVAEVKPAEDTGIVELQPGRNLLTVAAAGHFRLRQDCSVAIKSAGGR
jgi:hypothetical protein